MRNLLVSVFFLLTQTALASSDAAKVDVEASTGGVSLFVRNPAQLLLPDVVFIDAGGRPIEVWLSVSEALQAAEERHFFGDLDGWVGLEFYVVHRTPY